MFSLDHGGARRASDAPPGQYRDPVIRRRPQSLPCPEVLGAAQDFEGYFAVSFWEREDAFLVHPPRRDAICAVSRNVPVANVVQVSAAVHSARQDGPLIGFALGLAPSGSVTADNWSGFLGQMAYLEPAGWGVVSTPATGEPGAETCDLILVTQVPGRLPNDNAWALFRRFLFTTAGG